MLDLSLSTPLTRGSHIPGANNEDLTPLIERVIFQLHPSFNNPTRVVDAAPFHVTELGWGEFDIGIKIFFHGDFASLHAFKRCARPCCRARARPPPLPYGFLIQR